MTPSPSTRTSERLLEVGWFVVDDLDSRNLEILSLARERVLARVAELFPQFDWRLTIVTRPLLSPHNPAEASLLLQEGLIEHDGRGWDFTFVITHSELQTYYKSYAFAMPSRALSVAVVSLAGLLPRNAPDAGSIGVATGADRMCNLFLHLLGDLNGIEHRSDRGDYMHAAGEASEFDAMNQFAPETVEALSTELESVADIRLEERPLANATGVLGFYMQAMWHLRGDILSAVWQAQPWQFPFRLNRLTTGAVSTLVVLLMTAEAWDLGMAQASPRIMTFSLLILIGTSAYILKRQKLLLRRSSRRISEQIVLTNTAITLVVFFGMSTTYLLLLLLTLFLAKFLFSVTLISGWAVSLGEPILFGHYFALGQLIASLGILIGSLGASFEGQHYFRHITYVDEEL